MTDFNSDPTLKQFLIVEINLRILDVKLTKFIR